MPNPTPVRAAAYRALHGSKLPATQVRAMIKLLEVLEDLDDVQEVFSNADISDDVLAKL